MNAPLHRRYQIVSSEVGETETFDLETLSRLTGLHEELILEFLHAHLVRSADPERDADTESPVFDERGLLRLRQVATLREDRNVSLGTLRLIVRLLDRLEEVESELRLLQERLR